MAIEFWFINGSEKFRLPVNPSVNNYVSPFNYEEFEVEGIGEVTNIKRRGLIDVPIETHFPKKYNPTYCGYKDFPTPQKCLDLFIKWRDQRLPIRYVVTGEGGLNIPITIRDITVNANKSGNPGDIYVSISIKEYRDYTVTTVDLSKKKPTAPKPTVNKRPSTPATSAVKSYVVKKGDCLSTISKKKEIYGDANKWRTIYNANKKLIGPNPNKIYPGQKLVIPR